MLTPRILATENSTSAVFGYETRKSRSVVHVAWMLPLFTPVSINIVSPKVLPSTRAFENLMIVLADVIAPQSVVNMVAFTLRSFSPSLVTREYSPG